MEIDSRITQALLGITFLERSISIIVLAVSPIVLVRFLGTPTTIAGWTIAGFWIANAIGALVAVGLIRNRHSSLLIGFVVIAISLPEAAIVRNSLVYMGTMILSGFGLSLVDAFLLPTMHEKSSSRKRPQTGVASYSIALSLALVAGPLVAASAIATSNIFALFAVLGVLSLFAFFLTRSTGLLKSYSREDTRAAIFPANILKVLRRGDYQDYYVLNFLYSMFLPIFVSYGGIYGESKFHVGSFAMLLLFSGVFTLSALFRLFFAKTSTRHFHLFLVLSFSALFASFAIIGLADTFPLFLFGFLLYSVPDALIYPISVFMALESAGLARVITARYIFATSSGIPSFVSPLLVLTIIAHYSFSWTFLGMAPVAIAGIIISATILVRSSSTSYFPEGKKKDGKKKNSIEDKKGYPS